MARTPAQIVQEQLGQLTYNIAVLAARVEQYADECARLHAENEALKNPAPAKEVE
jgi:hypothetical protein